MVQVWLFSAKKRSSNFSKIKPLSGNIYKKGKDIFERRAVDNSLSVAVFISITTFISTLNR